MSHPVKNLFSRFAASRIKCFLEIMPMKRQYSTFAHAATREVNKCYLLVYQKNISQVTVWRGSFWPYRIDTPSSGTKALALWEERKEESTVVFLGILAVLLGGSEPGNSPGVIQGFLFGRPMRVQCFSLGWGSWLTKDVQSSLSVPSSL